MYYFLMHKNKKVALCKNDTILTVYEEKFLPMGIEKKDDKYNISKWKETRKIPQGRTGYDNLKKDVANIDLDIANIHEYNYYLTLQDHYWLFALKGPLFIIKAKIKLNKIDKNMPKYEDINYFTNPFAESFIEQSLSGKTIAAENIKTPDATTSGLTKKYWVIRNDKRFIVKLNDVHKNLIAEKEILASFVAYLINDCKKENKKPLVPAVPYQLEKGEQGKPNCCYAELFTNMNEELVTYDVLMSGKTKENKREQLGDLLQDEKLEIQGLQEYIEFIILLDYLIENNRKEDDIGFLVNASSRRITKPAPIYGNWDSFGYMTKDLTRANHTLYNSDHVNVFGMNEEEQCKFIAENVKWFSPQMLFDNSELLTEYLLTMDMHEITTHQKENIINWFNYKLALLQHTIRMIKIQGEMDRERDADEEEYNEESYENYEEY